MANFLDSFDNGKYNNNASTPHDKGAQSSNPERSSSGVKVTEHHVVVDESYRRNKIIRLVIICGILVMVGIAGYLLWGAMNRVNVLNFEGKTLAEAKAWATKNSVEVDVMYEFNKDIFADTVMNQSAKSGEKISKDSIFQLTVSNGANPDEKIAVPDFSTITAAQIQAWIDESKLTNTKISEENSDTIASGKFIKATYRDVTTDKDNFKRKDYLTITVSKGPTVAAGDVTMSNLVGKTKSEAESWASTNGISLITTVKTSETIATDKVISQDVKVGDIVKSGGTVNLVISGGTGIEVPNFAKVAMSEAQNAYTDFKVTVKQQYSSSIAYGKFISQSVAAGTHVLATDNKIVAIYSLGKPYLENLAGTSEKDLPSYFSNFVQKGANISYKVTYVDSDVEKGKIISTSKYNEYLSTSETISVVVSNGSKTSQGASKLSNNASSSAQSSQSNNETTSEQTTPTSQGNSGGNMRQ